MATSNCAHVLSRYAYHSRAGSTIQPPGLVELFCLFSLSLVAGAQFCTGVNWKVHSSGLPEGSLLCGLSRDFSELKERQKISEERSEILEG